MSATLLFLQNAECQSLHRMAVSRLCRAVVLPELEGCLAGVSLHRPLVQVHVCVQTQKNESAGLIISSLKKNIYMYEFDLYPQPMALQAVSCPHLALESLPVRLPPVQPA